MSDLTERLRSGVIGSDNGARTDHTAADRIEELEAERAEIVEWIAGLDRKSDGCVHTDYLKLILGDNDE